MLMRWLSYIGLLDFQVKHIPVNRNGPPDALSQRDLGPNDPVEDEDEADGSFDTKLDSIQASSQQSDQRHSPRARISHHEVDYEGDDLTVDAIWNHCADRTA